MHENPWPRKMRPPRNTSKPSGCSRTSSFATPKPLGPTWHRMPSTAVFRSGLTKKPTTRSTSNGRNSCPNTEPALSDGRGSLLVHPAEARAGLEKSEHADSTWSCVNKAPNLEVSMSTSLLYHAFGIRGYHYVRTEFTNCQVTFTIHQEPETYRCSVCGSSQVISRGQAERCFRSLPIGGRPTTVVFPIPRVECQKCDRVRQVDVSFADPRRSYTKPFERFALELSRSITIRDVALHLNVSWDLIKEIQKRDLLRRYAKPKLKHLRYIAIDEIAVAKGHRYLTVVMDLENGAVVFVGDGKGADALKPFWKRLRPSKAKIEAVAMDMSAASQI